MIQKTKRPISILLVLLMIVGMFTVLPISAGAADYVDDSVSLYNLDAGDTLSVNNGELYLNDCREYSVIFKGGTYRERHDDQPQADDIQFQAGQVVMIYIMQDYNGPTLVVATQDGRPEYYPLDAEGNISDKWYVLSKDDENFTITLGGHAPAADTWTFRLNSNFSGQWNADTDVVSEQPIELTLAKGDYEFQIVAYKNGNLSSFRGNEQAGSSTDTYSQIMHDNGGNAKFHADGGKYTLTYNASNGVLTINPVYVAEIDGTKYKTLEAAFAAAQDGATITLLANCAGNGIKVPQGKFNGRLTVDFNGFTYTVDGETVGSTGTETNGFQLLKGNNIDFLNGTIYSEKAKILVQNYSNLGLYDMTLTLNNTSYNGAYTLSNNNGNAGIHNTTINANPTPGSFAFDVCRFNNYPSINVEVTGEKSVINGNVEIFASNGDPKFGFSLTLSGGTMNGNIVVDPTAQTAIEDYPQKAVVTKANTFTQTAPEGFEWVDNGQGGSTLVALPYAAKINDTKYRTLEEAFAAAQDGDTITLLADSTGNGIKVTPAGKFADKGLIVDFDDFTYTVDGETVGSTGTETNGFQLLKDNKVTFKNGTITSEKAKILVQNYSDLTLLGMTLTLDNPNYTSAYTLSNNNGDVVIDSTTINANPAGGFAFDVCRFSSYPSVHVTVTGGSDIQGDVEISASKGQAKDGFSLTLESGTMTGNIVLDQTAKNVIAATPEKAVITKAAAFEKAAPADYKWDANGVLVPCDYVAQVGTAKYESLTEAIAAAQDGDTVTLLADITLPAQSIDGESSQYGAYITKSLTIDGDGHTVTSAAPRVFGVKGTQGDIDVTFKNITVTDKAQGAVCVCTRGGINSLTLDNATLSTQGATKGYIQPLTIGGSQATQAKVNVINGSTIQTGDAAGKHYAIILWNPVDLTIQDSTIKGWACVYQKPFSDATADDKTEVTIDNSTLISKGIKGTSNNFATIFTENADFTCEITNTTMDITAAADTYQAIAASNGSASGFEVKLGEGNNVTLTGDTAIIGYNFDDATHEIAVSGGTFNKPVAEYYCAEGYIPATLDEETGKYSVKTGTYVAEIDGVKYETLADAFAAAVDGDTITLLANCAGNGIKVTPAGKFADKGLTVDFAGFTYTVDGETVGSTGTETNGFQLLKNNKVTFKNGTITSAKAKILVQNYSDLTLDGMTLTLDNPNYTSAYTLSNNNGNIVIDGTTINANPAGGFAFDVCRFSSYPSVHVTVKGESVINGNVEISASKGDAKQGFSLTLESGSMTGNIVVDASAQALVGEDNKVTKADTFTKEAPADFRWVDNGDGTSTLAPIPYVAKIGNTKYETLADAFAAAVDGDTITLLANCAGNGIKVTPAGKFAEKGLTVDFAGFTYTVDGETVGSTGTETNGFQLLKNNKVTFKNGTITSAKAKILVQNYSDLTLEGMTLTLNNPDYTSAYTLSNNNGNIVIDGTTINANPAGGFAFDVCRFSSYPSVNVKVTGESVINGNVEISASKGDAKEGFSLTLESGSMTGNIVVDASAQALVGENNKVTKANTFNQDPAEGFKWKDNGDGTSTLVKIPDLFVGNGLALHGDIGVIFYLNPEAAGFSLNQVTSVSVDFACDKYSGTVTEYTKDDATGCIKVAYYVPVAYMASDIIASNVKINNLPAIGTDTYSVQTYALDTINDPNAPAARKTLMKEMLNYGAKAKAVFESQMQAPDKAVYEEIPDYTMTEVTAAMIDEDIEGEATDMSTVTPEPGAVFYGSSVIYLSETTLRMVFAIPDGSGSKLPENAYTGHQGKWYHWVDKKDIPAAELHKQQTFTVGDATFTYSALDYAKAVLNSNMDQANKDLVSAMYLYNQAAIACFA